MDIEQYITANEKKLIEATSEIIKIRSVKKVPCRVCLLVKVLQRH